MLGQVERKGEESSPCGGRKVSGPSYPAARIASSVGSISSATVPEETKAIERWLQV